MDTKIVVADDHQLFRKGIISLLKSCQGVAVIGEAANGEEALQVISETGPDILMLDLQMPVMNGYAVLERLQKEKSSVKTIIISMFTDEKDIATALEAGAVGFLSKNADLDEIIKALQSISKTGFYFNDDTNKALLHRLISHKRLAGGFTGGKVTFSNKELEVLQLLSEELTHEEIGKRLFTSPRTIDGIRHEMIQKVGAKNIIGLFKYAVKNHLVEI